MLRFTVITDVCDFIYDKKEAQKFYYMSEICELLNDLDNKSKMNNNDINDVVLDIESLKSNLIDMEKKIERIERVKKNEI